MQKQNKADEHALAEEVGSITSTIRKQNPKLIQDPFPHVIIDDCFPENINASLLAYIEHIRIRGLSEEQTTDMFSRFSYYDAYSYTPDPKNDFPSRIFYSREWKDLFSELFDADLENDTIAALHHHEVGSANGAPHNDYVGCWFVNDPKENGINPWFHQCEHQASAQPRTEAYQRIRTIALIYYLSSEPWKPEDGGETGIYQTEKPDSLYKKVEPINNRLFAFQISPHSFHGFIKNHTHVRNSIIQWFFQIPEIAVAEHGVYPIQWGTGWNANITN